MSDDPIGSDPVSAADLAGPGAAAVLARLRARGPVAWLPDPGCWLVTGWDAAVAVMRDADAFTVDDPRFCTARVDRVAPDGRGDLRTALAGPLSVAVVASALGLHDVHAGTVLGWYAAIVARFAPVTDTRTRSPRAISEPPIVTSRVA